MARSLLRILYDDMNAEWRLDVDGEAMASFQDRRDALNEGWRRGDILLTQGRHARLIVHTKDGSIEAEFPYEPGSNPLPP